MFVRSRGRGRLPCRQTKRENSKETERGRDIDRQTDRQTDRQRNKALHTHLIRQHCVCAESRKRETTMQSDEERKQQRNGERERQRNNALHTHLIHQHCVMRTIIYSSWSQQPSTTTRRWLKWLTHALVVGIVTPADNVRDSCGNTVTVFCVAKGGRELATFRISSSW